MVLLALSVCSWWHLQRLIQQPKFIHATSSGSARTRSAAKDVPQANLFIQVRPSGIDQDQRESLEPHSNEYFFFFSCLIAMALKNSKTGSLPVSEIYSFMKEHFPYFKVQVEYFKVDAGKCKRNCPIKPLFSVCRRRPMGGRTRSDTTCR